MEEKEPKKKKLPKNVREKNGKYHYRYRIKDPVTGKSKPKETKGFATPKEAEREGIRIQASLLDGTYQEKVKITVAKWGNEWLTWYGSTGRVKEITVRQREAMLDMLKSAMGGLALEEANEDIYQKTLIALSKVHSRNTLISYHACAKMIFSRAVQKGKLRSNPAQYAYIPAKAATLEEREAAKRLPRYLEKDELKLFLAAVSSQQLRRLFELLALTGMRIGEASALLETDFDADRLNISKTRYVPKSVKNYQLTTPKNESSDRSIHLTKKAIKVIKDQLTWRKEFAFSKGNRFYRERNFLFFCEKARAGYPLHYTLVLNTMKAALEKAGLPSNLSPHSLRHTYTSLMAEAGADLDTIQAQLGHKKGSDVTRALYLHVTKAREKRDVSRLDALLDSME